MNIIITGASKGIGKAIAEKFAVDGNTLMLCARNLVALEETAYTLQQKYPQSAIHYKATDLSDYEAVTAFGSWCLDKGTPDILVNNSGQYKPGFVLTEPEGTLMDLLQNNLFSAY
ncbi:MAG: SDR family NAD(P)-dependent oxidoreductase, partial [Bacteroidia bacterium]